MHRTLLICGLLGLLLPSQGLAQDVDTLTAERVVALARTIAPRTRVADSEILAARGRLAGARALGRENPVLEGVAARERRFERRTQWELSVPIGIGSNWVSRVGLASDELRREQSLAADARRGAVGTALAGYYRVLHAMRRVEMARERRALAADLVRIAADRHRAGDAPRLEVLLTETEEARSESDQLGEERNLIAARIDLAAALGLTLEASAVRGDLSDRSLLASASVRTRPDVVAAEHELRAARASVRLAKGERLPGLAFRLAYGHESGDAIIRPGLAMTLPVFQNGQESRGIARARVARAEADLDRLRAAAASERAGSRLAYDVASTAADRLGQFGLPRAVESEEMARESYRAGKIDLPSLLIVRRELIDARREHLDRLLDAAFAGIDLAMAEGNFQ